MIRRYPYQQPTISLGKELVSFIIKSNTLFI
jgi:hypothetical protein